MLRRTRAVLGGMLLLPLPFEAQAFWGENWGEMVWGVVPSVPLIDQLWWTALLWLGIALLGARMLRRRRSRGVVALVAVLAVPLAAVAATIGVPYVFSNGTIADADQVNANFDTLVLESNSQDARIAALETSEITDVSAGTGLLGGGASGSVALSADTAYLQRRVSAGCPDGSSIRTISETGAVSCELDDSNIGDITGVSVGLGLTGGGSTGNVVVSVANGGIAAQQLATNAVGTLQLTDGGIFDVDVSSFAAISPAKIAGTAATLGFTTQSFGGGLLYLDDTTNRVGVNDTTPSQSLDVAGTVAATNFQFRSERFYYHMVRAAEFEITSSVNQSWISVEGPANYAYTNDDVTEFAYAALNLPQGADIENVTCYYYDADPTYELEDFDIALYSRSATSTSSNTLASVFSDPPNYSDTTIRSLSTPTASGTGNPVSNGSYFYSIGVTWDLVNTLGGSTSAIRFYGCRVGYRITTLALP